MSSLPLSQLLKKIAYITQSNASGYWGQGVRHFLEDYITRSDHRQPFIMAYHGKKELLNCYNLKTKLLLGPQETKFNCKTESYIFTHF